MLQCFFFVCFFWPQGMWDLSSLPRDQTRTPCIGKRSLNYWTAREVPMCLFLKAHATDCLLWGCGFAVNVRPPPCHSSVCGQAPVSSSPLWGQRAQPPSHVRRALEDLSLYCWLSTFVTQTSLIRHSTSVDSQSSHQVPAENESSSGINKYKPPLKHAIRKISLQERMPTLFLYQPDWILNTQQKRKSEFHIKWKM